jgi:hypothetical protein
MIQSEGSPSCCIVIPLHTCYLSVEELRSIRRCLEVFSDYDIRFLTSLRIASSCEVRSFLADNCSPSIQYTCVEETWFASIETYNTLMLQPWLYKLFNSWTYILIHQPDARIIDPLRLPVLLQLGFSYVGAPLVADSLWYRVSYFRSLRFYGGNGGLSLRKVDDVIRLLEADRFYSLPVRGFRDCVSFLLMRHSVDTANTALSPLQALQIFVMAAKMTFGYRNTLSTMGQTSTCQEDFLLSVFAPRYFKWFKVPPPSVAAQFMIDAFPLQTEMNFGSNSLLGCHGWEKNSQSFWRTRYPLLFP